MNPIDIHKQFFIFVTNKAVPLVDELKSKV